MTIDSNSRQFHILYKFCRQKSLQQKGFNTLQKLWLPIIRKKNIGNVKILQFNSLLVTKKYKWLKFRRNSYLGLVPMIQTYKSTMHVFPNLLFYLFLSKWIHPFAVNLMEFSRKTVSPFGFTLNSVVSGRGDKKV